MAPRLRSSVLQKLGDRNNLNPVTGEKQFGTNTVSRFTRGEKKTGNKIYLKKRILNKIYLYLK